MPQYGEVRIDYITYTTGVSPEASTTVTVSSLVGNPTFTGDVVISGDLFVSGALEVSGAVFLDNNLNVSGETVLNNLQVTGLGLIDELYVSGDATVTGNLAVTGNTETRGNLNVSGTSDVVGTAQFGNALFVTDNTTVSGDLYVSGTISGATDGGVNGSGYWRIPSGTTAERPTSARAGMIRWNEQIQTYEGYDGVSWGQLGGGATGSGTDRVFMLNEQTVNTSYTIPNNMNATSCGPITIVNSAEVIIDDGENWSIV